MFGGDSLVVTLRKSFPLDQVLECPTPAEVPVIDNFFDLLFLFPIDDVQWQPREVRPMTNHFFVRGEKRCMEDIVYPPIVW
jgi:hypothetical protein